MGQASTRNTKRRELKSKKKGMYVEENSPKHEYDSSDNGSRQ